MTSTTHDTSVGAQGAKVRITIVESSVDNSAGSSVVTVNGLLIGGNSNSGASGFNNISCSITGTQGFVGPSFGFPAGIAAGHPFNFIGHSFTVNHDSDGSKTVSFAVHYSDTGTAMFGGEQGSSATLSLTLIGSHPGQPGAPVATNVLPTSMTVSWTPPTDDGGYPIRSYLLTRYKGDNTSDDPNPVQSSVFGTTVNLTGLAAGMDYTFTVQAYNGPGNGTGYSDPSDETTVGTLAGAWMRVDGVWKVAIPYVRRSGTWHMAVPWIRQAGIWTETH